MTDVPDEVQRWTAKRKAAVVMSIVKGETSAAEAARKHGLTVAEIERWKEQFFAAGENALRVRPRDEEAAKDEQISRLQKKVGELVLGHRHPGRRRTRAALSGRGRKTSEAGAPQRLRAAHLSGPRGAALQPAARSL